MPTLLRKHGCRFHFFTAEPDEPPHVHIDGKGCTAKVWLRTMELQYHHGFKAQELKRIMETVEEYRETFLEAWNEFRG